MRIFLVRHAQSEGNHNKDVHKTVANHAIPLTSAGHRQAILAAEFLSTYIKTNLAKTDGTYPRFRMWVSPFARTRETARPILTALSGVKGLQVDYKENPNLVEIDPGVFDGMNPAEWIEKFPHEYALYRKIVDHKGKYWARFPLGESVFDVARRCHQAFGSFHRDQEKHGIENLVVVSHGTTTRAFTQMWLNLPFEWYESEPNPGNTWIRLIDRDETGKHKDFGYIYQPQFGPKPYDGRGK